MPTTTGWVNSDRRDELPPDWQQLRRQALERDEYRCQWLPLCGELGTDVDHIIPGLDHSLDNLQTLCNRHHLIKTARERVTYRQNRPREAHPGG